MRRRKFELPRNRGRFNWGKRKTERSKLIIVSIRHEQKAQQRLRLGFVNVLFKTSKLRNSLYRILRVIKFAFALNVKHSTRMSDVWNLINNVEASYPSFSFVASAAASTQLKTWFPENWKINNLWNIQSSDCALALSTAPRLWLHCVSQKCHNSCKMANASLVNTIRMKYLIWLL